MSDILKPRDETDVAEAVAAAVANEKTLEIVGHGTKRTIGRNIQTDLTLDLSALSGVELYEPDELVLSAKAGTPLAEIESLLAGSNQELAFEPVDCVALLRGTDVAGTIGGMVAAGLSGPRRLKAGAVRDHTLGVSAVSGRGEAFKSGGRVVKNVTGYDLSKLLAGSWGTLAVMTSLTLKVLPRAEHVETLLITGLDDARAVEAMTAAMATSCDVSGAAHLPRILVERIPLPMLARTARPLTALRLEGIEESVAYRRNKLADLLKRFGPMESLAARDSAAFWRAIRDAQPFADATWRAVWRISVEAAAGAKVGTAIASSTGADVYYDWAGGLVWAEMPSEMAEENAVRAATGSAGDALLLRADPAVRASAPVFAPLDAGLAALSRRLKESFDPKGVLNPGRMHAGI